MLYTVNPINQVKLPLFLDDVEVQPKNIPMFKIVFIEEGSVVLHINEQQGIFSSPVLFCLNEKEDIYMENSIGIKVKSIYYVPQLINSNFTLENIYDEFVFTDTARLDHFYLLPFIQRTNSWMGIFELDYSTCHDISILYSRLKAQVNHFEDNFWPCKSRYLFMEFLAIIQRCYINNTNSCMSFLKSDSYIKEVLLYLHSNFNKKITINELTQLYHINKNKLSDDFKKEVGSSIIQYLTQLRIKAACKLLLDSNRSIYEIMEQVGFSDISHAGRTFKKHIGYTPLQYKNKYSKTKKLMI